MKTKIFSFLFFIMLCSPAVIAQQTYSKIHGLTESDYSIKYELVLDNSYTIKNMPMIDANRLIDSLLNPKGVFEFPIWGFLDSPDGTEKMIFKGSLRLYGDKIYKSRKSE